MYFFWTEAWAYNLLEVKFKFSLDTSILILYELQGHFNFVGQNIKRMPPVAVAVHRRTVAAV